MQVYSMLQLGKLWKLELVVSFFLSRISRITDAEFNYLNVLK